MKRIGYGTLLVAATGIACTVRCGGWPFSENGASREEVQCLRLGWAEHFEAPVLAWIDPAHRRRETYRKVYQVEREGGGSFLRARHDARLGQASPPTRAIHYGQSFVDQPIPLDRVAELSWRWRVWQHPEVDANPWVDLAASIYFVLVPPTILANGTGFKLGWLARPGPSGNRQRGLVQIPIRNGGTTGEWRMEMVDPCALYRQTFGSCEGASVTYIGVVSDADDTQSVAAADYADFELLLRSDSSAGDTVVARPAGVETKAQHPR